MRRWFGTLAGRTTAVIAAVATVAVVLAGLLAAQLVNATAVDEAKKYLAVEADSLSKQSSLGSLQDLRADLLTHGARLAQISTDGRVTWRRGEAGGCEDCGGCLGRKIGLDIGERSAEHRGP